MSKKQQPIYTGNTTEIANRFIRRILNEVKKLERIEYYSKTLHKVLLRCLGNDEEIRSLYHYWNCDDHCSECERWHCWRYQQRYPVEHDLYKIASGLRVLQGYLNGNRIEYHRSQQLQRQLHRRLLEYIWLGIDVDDYDIPAQYLSLEEKIMTHIQEAEQQAIEQHETILTDWIVGHNTTYHFDDIDEISIVMDANLPVGAIFVIHRTTISISNNERIPSLVIEYAQDPRRLYQDGQPWHVVKAGDVPIIASRLKINTPYGYARFTHLDTHAELD